VEIRASLQAGMTDYAGCCHTSGSAHWSGLQVLYQDTAGIRAAGFIAMGFPGDGALVRTRAYIHTTQRPWKKTISIADIRDGASNTLLLSEKRANLSNWTGAWNDHGFWIGWDRDTINRGDWPPAPDMRVGTNGRFGSSHPGGLNVLWADGSVDFVGYTVAQEVFARMCHRNDGRAYSR
jgi:prepilin-type processing-associated H-X9-DG protein